MNTMNDTVDLREIVTALRRGVVWIIAGAVLGLAIAVAVTAVLRPTYEATATVMLRSNTEAARPSISQLGGLGDLFPMRSGFDTELEILTSRMVIGEVVDSLGLQARIREPSGLSVSDVFASARYDADLKEGIYRFERSGNGYDITSGNFRGHAVPGTPYQLNGAQITLRAQGLPSEFEVELNDREDAISLVLKNLEARKSGGDVARIMFRADDPEIAAAVPNALIAHYLVRRTTTDRGVNQHRYEFLTGHADSIASELTMAESMLRSYQESTGVFDPEGLGKANFERAMVLKAELEAVEAEIGALEQIVTRAAAGSLSPREIAAYPTFLRNAAINDVLSRLLELEANRIDLLERRTERDPDVQLTSRNIRHLEDQLSSLSQAYLKGLANQRGQLRSDLNGYRSALDGLPARAEESSRLHREVARLTNTLLALQGQLVESRLAAIAEGGDVRQIDVAVKPKEPVHPKPLLNLLIGLVGGLVVGGMGALGSSFLGQRVRDPREAYLAAGIPAIPFQPSAPLLLGGVDSAKSILVVPVGQESSAVEVGRRIAATAALQGKSVVLADLQDSEPLLLPGQVSSAEGAAPVTAEDESLPDSLELVGPEDGGSYLLFRGDRKRNIRLALQQLEERFTLVIVALPGMDATPTAALLSPERPVILTARAGKVTRTDLQEVVEALTRVGIPTSGIILQSGSKGADPGA